jgi:hypothetical protein
MADKESKQDKDFMSPEELKRWLEEEIRDSAKAHELRVKDATEFVTAYASGRISPEQAEEHLRRYDRRWGEALYGATVGKNSSDESILQAIDTAREAALHPGTVSHADRLVPKKGKSL